MTADAGARTVPGVISRGGLEALLIRHVGRRGCPVASPADPAVPESLECAESFGRVLGQFHTSSDDFEAPAGSEWTRVHPLTLLGVDSEWVERLYAHNPQEASLLGDWRDQAASALAATTSTDVGMCHGEAYPATCRFVDGGLAVAELDWAGEGDRTYDVATFRWTLALHARGQADDLFSRFLDAYAAVRDVPNLGSLDAYVAARHLWALRVAAGFADTNGLTRRAAFAAAWPLRD
jgi:hypothetical protein